MLSRRRFLGCLTGAIAAPMVLRSDSLMAMSGIIVPPDLVIPDWCPAGWIPITNKPLNRWQFPHLHERMAKLRLGDAHKSSVFKLGNVANLEWYEGYQKLRHNPYKAAMDTEIISVVPLLRSNGLTMSPGAILNHSIPESYWDKNATTTWRPSLYVAA